MQGIRVAELLAERERELELEVIIPDVGAKLPITVGDVNRPGLALTGFTQNFLFERIQILGETEMLYLDTLSGAARKTAIDRLFEQDVPLLIISKNLPVDPYIEDQCRSKPVPLLRTKISTTPFINQLTDYLNGVFAPRKTVHGSLVDVYGVGLLFTGDSGIGKSETALDLVERGHRLVADDIVIVSRRSTGSIIGSANELLGHRMEIRGVGIIDVREMFGIRSTRLHKKIQVELRLVRWDHDAPYERLGLEEKTTSILGVRVPYVSIMLVPGKNVTVLAEVVAMNHLIRTSGGNPAADLDERLRSLLEQDRSASVAQTGEEGETE